MSAVLVAAAIAKAVEAVVEVEAEVAEKKFFFRNHGWCYSQSWSFTRALEV